MEQNLKTGNIHEAKNNNQIEKRETRRKWTQKYQKTGSNRQITLKKIKVMKNRQELKKTYIIDLTRVQNIYNKEKTSRQLT